MEESNFLETDISPRKISFSNANMAELANKVKGSDW
jgi:hypothetical protein